MATTQDHTKDMKKPRENSDEEAWLRNVRKEAAKVIKENLQKIKDCDQHDNCACTHVINTITTMINRYREENDKLVVRVNLSGLKIAQLYPDIIKEDVANEKNIVKTNK